MTAETENCSFSGSTVPGFGHCALAEPPGFSVALKLLEQLLVFPTTAQGTQLTHSRIRKIGKDGRSESVTPCTVSLSLSLLCSHLHHTWTRFRSEVHIAEQEM